MTRDDSGLEWLRRALGPELRELFLRQGIERAEAERLEEETWRRAELKIEPSQEFGESREIVLGRARIVLRDRRVDAEVRAFQEGRDREESFRFLHDTFSRVVKSALARKGLSGAELEDLAQETWKTVYTDLDSFRRECSFVSWLFLLTRSTWRRWMRYRDAGVRKGEEVPVDPPADAEGAPRPVPEGLRVEANQHEIAERGERNEALRRAVEELPPQMRRCVLLHYFQDRPVRQVAQLLRIAEGTVKATLHSSRKRLGETYRWPPGSPGAGPEGAEDE